MLKETSLGLQVRAVSQNRAMARRHGRPFGVGGCHDIRARFRHRRVAGVALSQLTNVGPNLGQNIHRRQFMVVVSAGRQPVGTLVSGMTPGVANKFMEPWSGAVLAKILVLVFIILFIQKRPRGLFRSAAALRRVEACVCSIR